MLHSKSKRSSLLPQHTLSLASLSRRNMTIWIYGPHQTSPFSGLALRTSQQRFIKDDILCKGHNPWDFNIYGMTKTNVEWHLASSHKKLHFCACKWWDSSRISYSYNCSDTPIDRTQDGGTALFSINKATHRVSAKVSDLTY